MRAAAGAHFLDAARRGCGIGPASAADGFDPTADSSRIGGSDRYATAAMVAEQNWDSASTVIVANGEGNGIDALSASYLAGVKDAPILLTKHDSVPAETAAAIAKLKPSEVIVVGGTPSVSEATYASLTAGAKSSSRIAGSDRYETATKIVEAGLAATTSTKAAATKGQTVFLARGDLFGNDVAADALAASPVSYRGHVPILLVEPGTLLRSTSNLLSNLTIENA